jgi:hypothetical protein
MCITSDPIQDRVGLWLRKLSPLLNRRPILLPALSAKAPGSAVARVDARATGAAPRDW